MVNRKKIIGGLPTLQSAITFEDVENYFLFNPCLGSRPILVTAFYQCRGLDGEFSYITDTIAPHVMVGFSEGEAFEVSEIIVRLRSPLTMKIKDAAIDRYRAINPLPGLETLHDSIIVIESCSDSPELRELIIVDEAKSIVSVTPLFVVGN